ncbi:hypothetical protein [Nocardia sp. NBC_01009]|uniref:hypothetical protein n=1 Tax=Nocardia sp. NBC_01009 TaxID=2975996 RepID=UPI003869A59F|nr:hypothetical protein OHA42_13740 [Nocardia sp. NBC_01009]
MLEEAAVEAESRSPERASRFALLVEQFQAAAQVIARAAESIAPDARAVIEAAGAAGAAEHEIIHMVTVTDEELTHAHTQLRIAEALAEERKSWPTSTPMSGIGRPWSAMKCGQPRPPRKRNLAPIPDSRASVASGSAFFGRPGLRLRRIMYLYNGFQEGMLVGDQLEIGEALAPSGTHQPDLPQAAEASKMADTNIFRARWCRIAIDRRCCR